MDVDNEEEVPDTQNTGTEDTEFTEKIIENNTDESVPLDGTENPETPEKNGEAASNRKSEVFKKPVLLIGPRKGKVVGKVQAYKAPDNSEEKQSEETPSISSAEASTSESAEADNEITDELKEEPEKLTPAESKALSKFSPAQKLKENSVPLPYKEPKWSGMPTGPYKFEVLKNGSIVETIDLSTKPFYVVGRLANCDVHMAHPTVSRFHAVLQYRSEGTEEDPTGFYLYDLGSTHGTFLNKYRIKSNMYVRIHVGHLLKFGGSSRMFILQGPEDDMEKESELSITELKERRRQKELAKQEEERQRLEEERLQQEKLEKEGIDWGLGDDADEETDLSENPFAATNNEELYLDDPKKTLRGWFEREGYDLEYNVEEKGFGQFLCRIELPIEVVKGGSSIAETLVKGKKKEAVVQCALEACRILDRYGLLRQATHESRKRKSKDWEENDFYDSDEDTFLDRTGDLEKKRQRRMKAAGKLKTQTDTYDSLVKKHEEVVSQIENLEKKLRDINRKAAAAKEAAEEEDPLDAFMTTLSSNIPDKTAVNKLKAELAVLKQEETKARKLVNIARPASLPELLPSVSSPSEGPRKSKITGLIGARRKLPVQKRKTETVTTLECDVGEEEEEEAEEEEEEGEEEEIEKTEEKTSDTKLDDASQSKSFSDSKRDILTEKSKGDLKNSEEITPELPISGNESVPGEDMKKNRETVSDGKSRVFGPSLPPDFVPEGETVDKPKKKNRSKSNKKNANKKTANYSDDPNYSMWVPPEDQRGDGKTKLNEKYGY